MIKKIIFLLLILTIAHSQTCSQPTESSCLAANCFWGNGVCAVCNCTTCLAGYTYYYSANTTGCVPCSTLAQNNCTQLCTDYTFVPVLGCLPCSLIDPNCLTCIYNASTDTTQCTQCIVNYYLNPDDPTNCIPTSCDIPYCLLCATATSCYSCKTGFQVILNGSACGPATCSIPNCLICLSSTVCAVCVSNYQGYADMTTCQLPCDDPYCATCPTQSTCSQCNNGYSFINGYCQVICVVPYCVTCTSSTTCSVCQTNYNVGPFGTSCVPSGPPNCLIPLSSTTCAVCEVGFYPLANGTCAQTICYINQCLVCATTTTCNTCNPITTANSQNTACNYNCVNTVANCNTCSTNQTCTSCAPGYILNTTSNLCVPACTIPKCITCLTDGLCQYCDVNYTLTDMGTCVYDCGIPACVACNSSGQCTECLPNYQRSPDCRSCILVCSPGYYENNVNGTKTCQLCNLQIPNCYLCQVTSTNQVTCIQCWDNYYVTGSGTCNLCSDIIDNCTTCDSPAICTQCQTGYVLYTNQIGAVLCFGPGFCNVANCQLCTTTSSEICATCSTSYQKSADGKTCNLVVCLSTQTYDPVTQTCVCPLNTYLVNNKCTYCPFADCTSCTSSGCTTCIAGYFVSGGLCQPCPSHCLTCTSSTICTKCNVDYTLSGNTCIWACGCHVGVTTVLANGTVQVCPAGCSYCGVAQGSIYCITPSPGFSLNYIGDVIRCNSNCYTCAINNQNICTSCEGASILTGIFCLGCVDQYALSCSPTDASYSISCIPGYSPFGGVCQACDPNCKTCGNSGAGNCDDGQCYRGYVVIVKTHNCTTCFGGCSSCSQYNPSICIGCSPVEYADNSSKCQPCNTTCKTCKTADYCQTCPYGTVASNSVCYTKLPFPCYTQSGNMCTSCYQGYRLVTTASSYSCTFNLSCNTTNTCNFCPINTYKKVGTRRCFACRTSSLTCNWCNATRPAQCISCVSGYYLDRQDNNCYTCSSANPGCLDCESDITCTHADVGYYISVTAEGYQTGIILQCPDSCATCNSPTCLTCAVGYVKFGTLCLWQEFISGTITIGPGPGTQWFSYSQSDIYNLAYAVTHAGQIMSSLLTLAGIDATTFQNIVILGMSGGSIEISYSLTNGPGGDVQATHVALTNNIQNGNTDFSVIATSTTVNGGTTMGGETGANLGLILGITIPLVILLVVVMIFIKIYSSDTEEKETQETDKGVNQYEM